MTVFQPRFSRRAHSSRPTEQHFPRQPDRAQQGRLPTRRPDGDRPIIALVIAAEQVALEAAEILSGQCLDVLHIPPVSVVLHGSLAAGDFVPGHSDVDLLVVAVHPLADAEIDMLVSVVRAAELGGAAGIDLLVAAAEVCRTPTPRPGLELLVGRYPGRSPDFEVEARAKEWPDLVPELAMAREMGRALYGATPGEVIGAVPPEWIEQRGKYWLARWLSLADDADNAAFMVLTACRIWRFAVEGVYCSKSEAARWALARNPSLVAIKQALSQRTGRSQEPISRGDVTAVLNAATDEVPPR